MINCSYWLNKEIQIALEIMLPNKVEMDTKMSYEETGICHHFKKKEEKHIVEMLKCTTMKLMLPTDSQC